MVSAVPADEGKKTRSLKAATLTLTLPLISIKDAKTKEFWIFDF